MLRFVLLCCILLCCGTHIMSKVPSRHTYLQFVNGSKKLGRNETNWAGTAWGEYGQKCVVRESKSR